MSIFKTLFFSLKLLAKLVSSAIRIFIAYISTYVSLITVVGVVVVVLLSTNAHLVTPNKILPNPLPQEIATWQAILKIQPTSRDTLWNLSTLYKANNELDLAKRFGDQARQLDPNFNFSE